jgi:ribosomal protein S18 acetylase RimI-like enzyme
MNVTIRKAGKEDAAILAALGAKTFYDTFHQYHSEEDMQLYIRKAYDEKLIGKNLAKDTVQYFLAFDEDIPVGYSKLIAGSTHEQLATHRNIELEKIYVSKDYFDKKVGMALMVEAIRFAKEVKYETLFLGVWQENERAIQFYTRFGFETFAKRTFQLGSNLCDDFLMKLEL